MEMKDQLIICSINLNVQQGFKTLISINRQIDSQSWLQSILQNKRLDKINTSKTKSYF